MNDALIAMSAARLGIAVITANAREFLRLAEFRPFQWRVHDFSQRLTLSTRSGAVVTVDSTSVLSKLAI